MKFTGSVRFGLGLRVSLAAILLIAPPLAAQDSAADRLRETLPDAAVDEIESIASRAERAGVPPGLIYRKAAEGAAKRVPPRRIVQGVGEYAGRLAHASRLLNGRRHQASLVAGAEALNKGVPPAVIQELGRSRARDLAIPLRVVTDLSEVGVPPPLAVRMLRRELEAGAQPRHLLAASTAVKRMVRRGESPEKALRDVGRRLSEARQPSPRSGRSVRPRPRPDGGGNRNPGSTDGQARPRRPGTADESGGANPLPPERRRPTDARTPERRRPTDARTPERRRPTDARTPERRRPADARTPERRRPADARTPERRRPADARTPERRRPADGVRPGSRPDTGGARRPAADGARRPPVDSTRRRPRDPVQR
ncbi:MAG: hypothetical protein ABFS14_08300 [Gemmatimonadota bacterium]